MITPQAIIPASKSTKNTSKIIVSLALYTGLFCLLINDFWFVYTGINNLSFIFRGITFLSLIIIISAALFFDRDSRKLLKNKYIVAYSIVLLFYLLFGLFISENEVDIISIDFAAFRGFYIGIFIFQLIVNSFKPRIQFYIVVLIPALLVFYEQRKALVESDLSAQVLDLNTRVGGGLEYHNWYLISLLGIALILLGREHWKWKVLVWILPLITLYSSTYLAARRYGVICFPLIMMFAIIINSFEFKNGYLSRVSSLFRFSHSRKIITWLSIAIGVILLIELFLQISTSFQENNILVLQRLQESSQGDTSIRLRIDEMLSAISSLDNFNELLFGKGMGVTYYSPAQISTGYDAFWCHISPFTYLLRGGIILFAIFIYLFYIKFPLMLCQAFFRPWSLSDGKRTAILIVLPGILGWSLLALSEGRLTPFYSLQWGFALAAYIHIKRYGVNF
jgi:hypothetical protein